MEILWKRKVSAEFLTNRCVSTKLPQQEIGEITTFYAVFIILGLYDLPMEI